MSAKSIRLGSVWTIVFFICSFARTIVLTPLMLSHWGKTVFCFWALILSARALICFLPDSFIRYVVNRYNLEFHHDPEHASATMRSGMAFLILFSSGLGLLCLALFTATDVAASWLFDADAAQIHNLQPGLCLVVYIIAALLQNIQRMYAGVKEPSGGIWQNMMMESALLVGEVLLLGCLLSAGYDFSTCILADSALVMAGALSYMLHLYREYPIRGGWSWLRIKEGSRMFVKAGKLYAGNFFEKLCTDGLVLLLSFFRYDKGSIALFATVRTITNTPLLAGNLLLNTYTPEWQKAYVHKEIATLQRLLTLIRVKLGGFLLAGIVLCYPLYKPLFLLWTKGGIAYNDLFMALMLAATVFNLFGLGYSFILKGINAMNQLFFVMALKAMLILAGLALLPVSIVNAGVLLLGSELIVSGFLLPLLLRRQLQADGLTVVAGTKAWALLMYWLSVLVLFLFYYYL